jgi:indolepyruvate ferredoxin oxidoreductase beta subunit
MKNTDIVLCGLGGQGILFMTKILAQSALGKGIPVMGAETHGMAQRGGSVVSHLRLGKVEGSLVRSGTAHILLALEENEAYRNLAFLGKGGSLYVNGDPGTFHRAEELPYLEKNQILYRCTRAGKLAMELGTPMSANLALVGFFSAFAESPFTYDELRETVQRVTPDRFQEINLKVFDACHEMGLKASQ